MKTVNCGGLWKNSKTHRCVDFTTICPRRREGKPCAYCYVETARKNNFNAKALIDHVKYDGVIRRLDKVTLDNLRQCGGLRLFSFSDYMPEHDADIKAMLDDCLRVGLTVKAITKQPAFVRKYHDHPAIGIIHMSVDRVGSGVKHRIAREYRKKYAKAAVRCVVLNDADLTYFQSKDWIDVITLNHGANGFKPYRNAVKASLAEADPRICCVSGKCISCKLKCRKNVRGS